MSSKYKIRDQDKLYFVSFAVVYWVDVFTRKEYRDLFLISLEHCRHKKGLEVYAWCIMSNHVHLIIGSSLDPIEAILRDLKKYTATKIIEAIKSNNKESRKEWIIR